MRILLPSLILLQIASASASIIGIMDSGSDISHKDLAPKAWINVNEKVGSVKDLDNDGLPGDVNGWDFIENSPKVFNDKYNYLITDDVKTFYTYYSKYDLGQLNGTSPELIWLKSHSADQVLMNKVNFVSEYIHGTHVAGIAALNNPKAKILSMKIIPTVYQEAVGDSKNSSKALRLHGNFGLTAPTKTYDEFMAEVIESANRQVNEMITLHSILNMHKADVVNQSFGTSAEMATNFITSGFIDELKRDPTASEKNALIAAYFNQLFREGPKMFAAAPNTVFTIAAGNDNSNNDLVADFPSNIQAENKIVVAATVGYKSLADFSNYGATKVDVAAPGVAILSTAPTNTYLPLIGTSQATPFVTNIIASMKDLNSALSARDLKAIVEGTVDYKTWLKGKVKTCGIVNKARALKAAEFAKSSSIDLAISKARSTISDVAETKSLSLKPAGIKLNFRPIRPSLLIKKI